MCVDARQNFDCTCIFMYRRFFRCLLRSIRTRLDSRALWFPCSAWPLLCRFRTGAKLSTFGLMFWLWIHITRGFITVHATLLRCMAVCMRTCSSASENRCTELMGLPPVESGDFRCKNETCESISSKTKIKEEITCRLSAMARSSELFSRVRCWYNINKG